MIPEIKDGVFASVSKTMEEKGIGWYLEEFAKEQPLLAPVLFDNPEAKFIPILMLYFGIKSQMEADALNE